MRLLVIIKFVLSLLIFAGQSLEVQAQPRLYGLSPLGGDVFGTIYSTDISGRDLKQAYSFKGNPGAFPYFVKLCDGNDGKLYGLTSQGGRYGNGVLFSYDTTSGEYQNLMDFDGQNFGSIPRGSLTLASNGKLYGMCNQGGLNGYGTIFVWDIQSKQMTKLHDFDGTATGRFPFSYLMQASNGSLYGMCYQGGLYNEGVLFEYDILNDTVVKHVDFDGSIKGRNPYGSLMQASNGALYGMTYQGGSLNFGTFFSFEPGTNVFAVKFDFNGSDLGSNPYGTPLESSNGQIYALTYLGGNGNFGTIIEYDPVLDTCYKRYDFTGGIGGRNPYGELSEYNGSLYALLPFGGLNNSGLILSYNTSNQQTRKEIDLPGSVNGFNPFGSLTLCDNVFYGCTYQGGVFASGVLFKYQPGGNKYSKILDLNSAHDGAQPYGGLYKARNGKYYGLTYEGGKNNAGVLFEYDIEQSVYKVKAEFNGPLTGKNPYGSLCEAYDNALYGYCYQGGSSNYGTIFKYDWNLDTLTIVRSLDDFVLGRNPYGSMVLAPDSQLYGMVSFGGTDDFGVIIQYNPSTDVLTPVYEFKDSTGTIPFGALTVYDSVTLYGCTYQGGNNDLGVLFKFDIRNFQYTVIHHFDGSTGSFPQGKLLLDTTDSTLFGTAQAGGLNFNGVLFSYQPSTSTFKVRKHLGLFTEKSPSGQLMMNSQGWIVGTTRLGGADNKGVVFAYQPGIDSLIGASYFDGINGQNPSGELVEFCLPSRASLKMSACYQMMSPSGKYVWTQNGLYNDTIKATTGCDSIMQIELTLLDSSSFNLALAVCDSFVAADGQTFKQSGRYEVRIQNYLGCDSIIHLNLSILNSEYDTLVSVCDSFIAADGQVLTQSGNYKIIIPNYRACDSLIRLELQVLSTSLDTNYRACRRFVAPDGKIYTKSGSYQAKLQNSNGCDSVIHFQLDIDTIDTRVTAMDEVLTAESVTGNFRWLNCADYSAIAGETSQTFKALKNGTYAVEIEDNNCRDTSSCYTVSNLLIDGSVTSKIRLYPNPVNERLTIHFEQVESEVQIELIDLKGQVVVNEIHKQTGEIIMNIQCPSGVYILKIKTPFETYTYRLIKQ